jgi:hypothetical protein
VSEKRDEDAGSIDDKGKNALRAKNHIVPGSYTSVEGTADGG